MMQNNLKVAITGGIGSGKSSVAEIIEKQGYPVISCDLIYRELLNDQAFLLSLSEEFGNVLTHDNHLDRKKLSSIVFNDFKKLERLNQMTHPAIMERALKRMSGEGLFFCEVPLLFECGFEDLFDRIIVVARKKEERVSATIQRDGLREEEVILRINSQIDYDKLSLEKYYVIHNTLGFDHLYLETMQILKKIKSIY